MLCCGYTLTDCPISIRLTSLALWQSNDCPSASKATLRNMDKYLMWIHYERLHNHNNAKHNKTVCIFLGTYCRPKAVVKLPVYTGIRVAGGVLRGRNIKTSLKRRDNYFPGAPAKNPRKSSNRNRCSCCAVAGKGRKRDLFYSQLLSLLFHFSTSHQILRIHWYTQNRARLRSLSWTYSVILSLKWAWRNRNGWNIYC